MRRVHLEGGPYDGQNIEITEHTTEIVVVMRSHRSTVLPVNQQLVTPLPRGTYVLDPLDDCTMLWNGEF